jgi:hypothetical protein
MFPDWSKKFHVNIDASTIVVREMLTYPGDDQMDHPNSYASQKLNKVERNYSTTKREGLCMIFSLQKLWQYLLENPFLFYIDH